MTRQAYTIEEIKGMLADRVEDVARHYAPEVAGSYVDKGKYYTLNPGRADKSVGSFVVNLHGPNQGRFKDFASGDGGDMIDLIQLALNTDIKGALREARAFLGLQSEDPKAIADRKRVQAQNKERRKLAEAEEKRKAEKRSKRAKAMWLSAEADIAATPVGRYLHSDRAIDLGRLPRLPRAIRYLRECYYREDDPETGEVNEGKLPAMVSAICRGPSIVAVHRTYLAMRRDGTWGKAPLRSSKKVFGEMKGGAVRVWAGIGPRGGHPAPLAQAGPDQHVYIAEGIEDALTAVMVLPDARVLAAISLGNLGQVELPANVSRVTLIADRDEGAQAQELLDRAIKQHSAKGREVRVWLPPADSGAKDINEYWKAKLAAEQESMRCV